jgi:lipid-binding SYLF domain-containing protein
MVQLLVTGMPAFASEDSTEAQGIVDKAKATFNDFMADPNYSWLREHIKDAKGLLIFPQIIKGGFFVGGSGGTGVLVVRDEKTGDWSQPSFYTAGSVSLGLQIGGEAAGVIVMVMKRSGVDSLFSSALELGGDVSVAIGPVGAGAKGELPATFISFAKGKGLYAGLNLEGTVVAVRDSLNKAYYGRVITPLEIIVEKKVANPGSAELLATLKKGGK